MANLKDIRKRISSVRSTQQITRAMKMVSAAKLRRAEDQVAASRPYSEKLQSLLANLANRVEASSHPFLGEGSDAPVHVLLITSDRGLCGAYNTNLSKAAEAFMASEQGEGASLTVCGRRGNDYFKNRSDRVLTAHVNVPGGVSLELAREVSAEAARLFTEGDAGSVYLVYSEFKSAMTQIVRTRQILPIDRGEASSQQDGDGVSAEGDDEATDYLFEPGAEVLLAGLLPRYLETTVYQAMLEGAASEHGARMTAMDSATRNAGEMMDALTLQMNKARQATITGELMEIIAGAEALNG